MARKRSPVYQKVSNLLRISISIAKMKKPLIPKLICLMKKSSELKKFNHYNYGYIQEYQFSPSRTPLIHYHRRQLKKRNYSDMCSIFSLCQCFGRLGAEGGRGGNGIGDYPPEALPPDIEGAVGTELSSEFSDSGGGEGDSVDERAERFIEKFYEEMRMQRKESLLQLMDCRAHEMIEVKRGESIFV